MRQALICLLAIVCLGMGLADKQLSIKGVAPGLNTTELEGVKGKPDAIQADIYKFDHGETIVRVKDEEVVFVSGFDLEARGHSLALYGVSREYLERTLGKPQRIYVKGPISTYLYPGANADAGVMLNYDSVAGFMLQQPGTLGPTLEQAGYR